MSEAKTVYEQAITTGRTAEKVAKAHNFEGVAQIAQWLPPDAKVLDVGAGASPFGKEVVLTRPDITWVNFDYSYHNSTILADVSTDAPNNLEYQAGDVTKLDEVYKPETFDAVFSFWLLPHLSIDDTAPAEQAAKNMFSVLKTGGLISVGPAFRDTGLIKPYLGTAIQTVKDGRLDADSYANRIVAATKRGKFTRYLQAHQNEALTPLFGTSRYFKVGRMKLPRIYHPKTGEYASLLSPRGISMAGRVALALGKDAARRRPK